jgi:hypothetical protein
LEILARTEFSDLRPAELQLIRSATTTRPSYCGPADDLRHPANRPEFSETGNPSAGVERWGPEREVRAEVIRWLCVNAAAKALVDPLGLQLVGARLVGGLDLRHTDIPFPLSLVHCRAASATSLNGCRIQRLEFDGSCLGSIFADGVDVKKTVYLRGVEVNGTLSLNSAKIGGTLTCEGGSFSGSGEPAAIWADGIKVSGDVLLRRGSEDAGDPSPFQARGPVRFIGAHVDGDLDCSGGEFLDPGEECVLLQRAVVHGELVFDAASRIGGALDLENCVASEIEVDPKCWPKPGSLKLDGFVYMNIVPGRADLRLSWLKLDSSGATQPYRQLAKIMKDAGDANHATCVLIEMEKKLSASEPLRPLKALIGYGYRPGRAVWALIVLWLLGTALCWNGDRRGIVVPTDKDVAASFAAKQVTPDYYPAFQPVAFSLENTFPLVKLGQADKWQPVSSSYVRWLVWLQTVFGWLSATLFVAGVSGIVQHD